MFKNVGCQGRGLHCSRQLSVLIVFGEETHMLGEVE